MSSFQKKTRIRAILVCLALAISVPLLYRAVSRHSAGASEKNAERQMGMALLYAQAGHVNEAVIAVQESCQARKSSPSGQTVNPCLALGELGQMIFSQGKKETGLALMNAAIESASNTVDRAELERQAGELLSDDGKSDGASAFYEMALRTDPNCAAAHNDLGLALAAQGDLAAAIEHYQEAVRIDSEFIEARCNLAAALMADGRLSDARSQWYETARIDPECVDALNDLAWMLATSADETIRNGKTALGLAKRADELTHGKDAGVLETLAAACAAANQFTEATNYIEQAIAACDAGDTNLMGTLKNVRQLLRNGQALQR